MAFQNQFDLCFIRRKGRAVRSADDEDETDEVFDQKKKDRDQENKDNAVLNEKSGVVREKLNERRWALMYLQHLAKRVNQADRVIIHFSVLPSMKSLSLNDSESKAPIKHPQPPMMYKASIKQHIEVLEQRERDAQIGMDASWAALNTLAVGLLSDIQGYPEDVDIAFRFFHSKSHVRFFASRGDVRCSAWQQFDISQSLEKEGAENHITGTSIPTNYVSISTSPRRIWSIAASDPAKYNQEVAVIDLRVLRRLGIAYGSSTNDLGFRHLNRANETGTLFATKHHCLVVGWLPSQSIRGFLSIKQFKSALEQAEIDISSSVSLYEYDKKIKFTSILQYLPGSGASSQSES